MIKPYFTPLALIIIFGFSLFVRVYQLAELPSILNRDEAALGYNGYLIRHTGQDEWQRPWPITFESFGDYKLPGYIYTLAGLFAFLPINDLTVRLPSAIAGSLLVLISFFWAKNFKLNHAWAILFSILIATTPVLFFFSRMAFEANLALLLFVSSLTLFLSPRRTWKKDALAGLLYLLAIFTYNTPLLIWPLILPTLVWLRGVRSPHSWWLAVGLSLVITIVGGALLLGLSSQKSAITIFQDETKLADYVQYRQQFDSPLLQKIVGNRYVYLSGVAGLNYIETLRPTFMLRAESGHPWHSPPGQGHLLSLVYFFGLAGLIVLAMEVLNSLFRKKLAYPQRLRVSLLWWTFVSFLPAVLTVDAPHATRSLLGFYLLTFVSLLAMKQLYHFLRDNSQIKKPAFGIAFTVVMLAVVVQYGKNYFINYQQLERQAALKPGFNEVIREADQNYPDREVAVVDGDGYQYVLLAWYLQIPPETFFTTAVRQQPDRIGFKYGERVNRYHFIANSADRNQSESLLVFWNGSEWKMEEY